MLRDNGAPLIATCTIVLHFGYMLNTLCAFSSDIFNAVKRDVGGWTVESGFRCGSGVELHALDCGVP